MIFCTIIVLHSQAPEFELLVVPENCFRTKNSWNLFNDTAWNLLFGVCDLQLQKLLTRVAKFVAVVLFRTRLFFTESHFQTDILVITENLSAYALLLCVIHQAILSGESASLDTD